MTRDDLIEQLADIEHQRWADWQKYVHSRCHTPDELDLTEESGCYLNHEYRIIPSEWVERWERQITTPYAELSEPEKQSDREQVARYWPLIVEFVAGWLIGQGHSALAWVGEMLPAPEGETGAERYARLNIRLPDGRRLLGPPDPPRAPNRPREVGGWDD